MQAYRSPPPTVKAEKAAVKFFLDLAKMNLCPCFFLLVDCDGGILRSSLSGIAYFQDASLVDVHTHCVCYACWTKINQIVARGSYIISLDAA